MATWTGFLGRWTNFGWGQNLPRWMQRWLEAIPDAEMWVRYRVQRKHMYNHVFTDLKPGYYDIDYVMEHALVALLRRYVDEEMYHMQWGDDKKETGWEALQERIKWLSDGIENPEEGREWEADMTKPHLTAEKEIAAIYQWFCIDKPKMEEELATANRAWITEWRKNTSFTPGRKNSWFTEVESSGGKLFQMNDTSTPESNNLREIARDIENRIETTTDDMLVRLVKVRGTMWT